MKKRIMPAMLVIFAVWLLAGCGCKHQWKPATCTEPQICSLCGLANGEPLAHRYDDATCTKPQTCYLCGHTNGQPAAHDYADATCTEPKTCERCGTKMGMALEHTYERTVCVRCGNKEVETLDELIFYLNRNYRELNTAVGKVEGITYEITNHERDLFAECDFELQIMSVLYSKER
ncbi:MAG: hypothetical protein E7619_10540 [Ruminococcaceae bacterium]|nr:hypothetical protein [Oscillospiraceae bacterium]